MRFPRDVTQPQPADAIWTQQTAWRLSERPVLQINGSEDKVEQAPLDPVSVFRLADGRYVIADGDQNGWHALLVYNAQEDFVGKVGSIGMGPGEFRQLFGWAGNYAAILLRLTISTIAHWRSFLPLASPSAS